MDFLDSAASFWIIYLLLTLLFGLIIFAFVSHLYSESEKLEENNSSKPNNEFNNQAFDQKNCEIVTEL